MKTPALLMLCFSFALAARASAAELVVEPQTLNPKSTLEVRFDKPMIKSGDTGQEAAVSPLSITPPLEGVFKWTSTRSGQYRLTKPPVMGASYSIKLRPGLTDVEGRPVDAEDFGEVQSEGFRVAQWSRYNDGRNYRTYGERKAAFVLQFNDAVNPGAFDGHAYLRSGQEAPQPVAVRALSGAELRHYYQNEIHPTWEEAAAGVTPKATAKEPRPNAYFIESKNLLPPGQKWELVLDKNLSNASGTASLGDPAALLWGTVVSFAVQQVEAVSHFERSHEITVQFNKPLVAPDQKPEDAVKSIAPYVHVEPAIPHMSIEASYNSLSISGDLQLRQHYTVSLDAGLPGADGLGLDKALRKEVVLEPSPAFVSTSAFDSSQLAMGKGLFDIFAANFKNMRVRVKQLGPENLLGSLTAYQAGMYAYKDDDREKFITDTPFEKLPGQQIFDRTFANDKPLEKGTLYRLNWHDILGQTPAAPVYAQIEADPQAGAPDGAVVARAIIQFTDIGLFVKDDHREALVYAFSLASGEPLPDVELQLASEEKAGRKEGKAEPLAKILHLFGNRKAGSDKAAGASPAYKTDAGGMARIPSDGAKWLLATKGADSSTLNLENNAIGLWHYGLATAWNSPWKTRHSTYMYSDRPVYKPGDIAHVRAISRTLTGDTLSLSGQPFTAELTLRDPKERAVSTKAITFSAGGTWSDDIKMPETLTGYYSLTLDFPKPKKALNKDDADAEEQDADDRTGASLQLRVDDYKPNTFEVQFDDAKRVLAKDRITVPLSAHYYMGKALSSAKLVWNASLQPDFTPPEAFAEYHFGDADKWWHYGEDRDEDQNPESDEKTTPEWGAHGELTLSDGGAAEIQLPPPPPHKAALPQTVTVVADVTDVNQQTISASSEFKVPGADFIVGAKPQSWYGVVGKPMEIDYVAVAPEGGPFTGPVGLDLKIERQEWNTVRVKTAGGAAAPKNQVLLIEEGKATLALKNQGQGPARGVFTFTPKQGGTYFVTATSADGHGHSVFTRLPFYVISNSGFPWAVEQGNEIGLQPDKTKCQPGDVVTLVVKTPFAGNALVSVERNRVQRTFRQPISPENPVVRVSILEEDAPNVFISVLVIRGSSQSPQPDPMPEYRLGYAAIDVLSQAKKLIVEVGASQDPLKPGEEETVSATVKDAQQHPVGNAEVNLYAVDEGVLSLMSYQTPDPGEFFYAKYPLAVRNLTAIGDLLPEAEDQRERGNKGVAIGGGGDDSSADSALRKNFVATAVWSARLVTDPAGRVTTTFKAPDSLTRYRIMAVAVKDADRFGSGASSFTVNKPLMLEPVVPRFAHVGDEILLKAVLHNTTKESGNVEVELKLDDTATLIQEPRPYALAGLQNRTLTNDGKIERRVIPLKAGETSAVAFPVKFVHRGSSGWQWRVHTVKWSGQPQTDGVVSSFEVTPPAPALREVHYFELTSASAHDDLLKRVNPQVLEAEGDFRLDLSTSRMGEARDGLEFLLHYPYGCVEQTTSALLPWLALSKYEALFPDLIQKDKTRDVLIKGRDRLLTMQTQSGGLSYWPGGEKPLLWASAYGGMGLVKLREWGVPVPTESLDKLTGWISAQLRELNLATTNKSWDLYDAPLALYTLARAGKAEPAYETILYQRRDNLPEMSRLFLALAMSLSHAPEAHIQDLLAPPKEKGSWEDFWLGDNTAAGLRLLIELQIGETKAASAQVTDLFQRRNGQGHWGTTFSNAWDLLALSAAEHPPTDFAPLTLATQWKQATTLNLPTALSTASLTGTFTPGQNPSPLTVTVPGTTPIMARLETKAYPDMKTFQPVSKGFEISRTYERLSATGVLEAPKDLRVGDLVVVTLQIHIREPHRYVAIEDPLPSVFEPINPEFGTQNQRADAKEKAEDNAWFCDYRELRNDRALFFTDNPSSRGNFELRYLARVIAEGDVLAPPTRIEAMYQPEQYGLGAIDRVQTLPMTNDGKNVVGK